MPTPWVVSNVTRSTLGRFQIVFSTPGGSKKDVTFFRGVPTELLTYTNADPFGDSTCQIRFPQVTIFDEIGQGELAWLHDFSDVDIYLVPPGAPNPAGGTDTRTKVWEGFMASMEFMSNEDSYGVTVQCQGALFQLDKYVQAPSYPPRPITFERQMALAMSPHTRPHLRTQPLSVVFPTGWTKVQPAVSNTLYSPIGTAVGAKITGFQGRSTGSWDRVLTSYIQNMLQVMVTDNGDSWSMYKNAGRQPVLKLRQRNLTPKYSVVAGQPGVSLMLTRDMTQYANIVYGQGTDVNGVQYSRMIVSSDGSNTTYDPMAYDPRVQPTSIHENARFDPHVMRAETYIKYDNGFDERQALSSAAQTLRNDMDPGLSGTMTLSIDPQGGSRFLMQSGDKILVTYLIGSSSIGVTFHIAEVNVNVAEGSVDLKIDTKFRDLLTLQEALNRTRDPLTPVKMLQLNKRTQVVDDVLAPWDYRKGSGFIPKASTNLYKNLPSNVTFPYTTWTTKYPPKRHPDFYVRVNANASTADKRWATQRPIRMAERADIRLTQFCVYDYFGNRLAIPFHVSIYYNPVPIDQMPRGDNGQHSPFIEGAFETTNQWGLAIPAGAPGAVRQPDQSLIIGWGNHDQPAGYSPGSHASGDPCTGILVDDSPWSVDFTNGQNGFQQNPTRAGLEREDTITVYANFYAEYKQPVYFLGRLFRKEPGTG